jgi:hypothetical protein
MAVQLICPNLRCRKFITVSDHVRGQLAECHHCRTTFRVPEPIQKPVPAAASPARR